MANDLQTSPILESALTLPLAGFRRGKVPLSRFGNSLPGYFGPLAPNVVKASVVFNRLALLILSFVACECGFPRGQGIDVLLLWRSQCIAIRVLGGEKWLHWRI